MFIGYKLFSEYMGPPPRSHVVIALWKEPTSSQTNQETKVQEPTSSEINQETRLQEGKRPTFILPRW